MKQTPAKPTEPTTVEWSDHWQTWSLNHGYYGAYYPDVDQNRTCWSIEWCATKADADALAGRAGDIDALVCQYHPADARGNRRVRLDVKKATDGSGWIVREYDYRRWAGTLPLTGAPSTPAIPAAEWIVRCRVSGGVTGTREAILKNADGAIKRFDEAGARAEAERLIGRMNHASSVARFEYWPEREDGQPVVTRADTTKPADLQTIADYLQTHGCHGVTVEYPGFLNVWAEDLVNNPKHAWNFGTANGSWQGDLVDGSGIYLGATLSTEIPATETDATVIARAILHVLQREGETA